MMKAPKGLEGVVVTQTSISKIDGQRGELVYRGYDATELASKLSFEQVAYLLWFGKIATARELSELKSDLASKRALPKEIGGFLDSSPKSASPLTILRTATSLLGMYADLDEKPSDVGASLTAKFPTILARQERARSGQYQVEADSKLTHVENYIHMLTGSVPSKDKVAALDSYLILLADHGMNASTFAARVAISTLTDVYSAVVAAIGTLKGPLHGGAPSEVWKMLSEIGTRDRSRTWLKDRIARGDRIMGFGHRVYRTEDPRSKKLKEIAKKIADPQVYELATTVEADARELLHQEHPERVLDTNVEFYSSVVLNAVGIPVDMFTPTFACARIVGWTAHIIEQLSDNRLFRPDSEYVGPIGLKLS